MHKKGQISIELLIVILFLIVFIYVHNTLAEQTTQSLELIKIKEQQQEIVMSFNEFLQSQRNVLYVTKIEEYVSKYKISDIYLASKKPLCNIYLSDTEIRIETNTNGTISYSQKTSLPATIYTLPLVIGCGQEISCTKNKEKIECS